MKHTVKVLFLVGTSGSGKTYIAEGLVKQHSEKFAKLEQYTTRSPRENEDSKSYRFVTKEEFDEVKEDLICRTEINGNFYGTIPNLYMNQTSMMVVNVDGLNDGLEYINKINNNENSNIKIRPIIMYVINDKYDVMREDRDINFVMKEKEAIDNYLKTIPNAVLVVDQTKEYYDIDLIASWIN